MKETPSDPNWPSRPKRPCGPSRFFGHAATELNRDHRIRHLAVYDVTKGNTIVVDDLDVWNRFREFKTALRSGEYGLDGIHPLTGAKEKTTALDRLEEKVMTMWSGAPQPVNADELALEEVLRILAFTRPLPSLPTE